MKIPTISEQKLFAQLEKELEGRVRYEEIHTLLDAFFADVVQRDGIDAEDITDVKFDILGPNLDIEMTVSVRYSFDDRWVRS